MSDVPVVLFLCTHNAGRSLAAKVLLDHYAKGRIDVRSAGSDPAKELNPSVLAVLRERGLDPDKEFPKPLTEEAASAADVVVTMGCGDTCPVYPGKRYEDWELEDPAGKPVDVVRPIVEEIDGRVQALLAELMRKATVSDMGVPVVASNADTRDGGYIADVAEHPTLYAWAGGRAAFDRMINAFYDRVETDDLLSPLFPGGVHEEHRRNVTTWWCEVFGGPKDYSAEVGGYERMLQKHLRLGIDKEQRFRFASLMSLAADDAGMPDDPEFRSALVAYLEWGTRLAFGNSQDGAQVVEHAPVPLWGWGEAPPYQPSKVN